MKVVEAIVNLRRSLRALNGQLTCLKKQHTGLLLSDPGSSNLVDIDERIDAVQQRSTIIKKQLTKHESDLQLTGVIGERKLEQMKRSKYYEAVVQARAYATRLLDRLVQRKFELTQRLENYRAHQLGMCRTASMIPLIILLIRSQVSYAPSQGRQRSTAGNSSTF